PAGIRFEIHVRQLPSLAPVIDARLQPPRLLFGTDLHPIFQEDNTIVDEALLELGCDLQKAPGLLFSAEPHHPLDAGAMVPAAVEDHDLPGRVEMRDIALGVQLRLLRLGRRATRNDTKNTRAHPPGPG